jgi:hypothetical protein
MTYAPPKPDCLTGLNSIYKENLKIQNQGTTFVPSVLFQNSDEVVIKVANKSVRLPKKVFIRFLSSQSPINRPSMDLRFIQVHCNLETFAAGTTCNER